MNLRNIYNLIQDKSKSIYLQNKSWKTKRKIIVIESDDWGTIRMPSLQTYNSLLKNNIRVDKCNYCSYDTLESEDDFEALFNILSKYKGINNNNPTFTANFILANPDFPKINFSNFNEYKFEKFIETYNTYGLNNLGILKEGISSNLILPQFHGREHVNVARWLRLLQNDSVEMKMAFENRLFGISSNISNENNPSVMAAFDLDTQEHLLDHKEIIKEGLNLFEEVFGYKSLSFIAPNYVWHSSLNETLAKYEVRYLQGGQIQYHPNTNGKFKHIHHYLGEKNQYDQIFLTRNCLFEPSSLVKRDWVNTCLKQIHNSFNNSNPVIICTHRVNYVGGLNIKNRENNLKLLDNLLARIVKTWPEVEFMTTVDLGKIIEDSKYNK